MLLDLALLIVGLALLLLGGRTLVDGAVQLSASLGVSELAIGLTVVAFGTSAPELAVNGLAALRGDAAIAFGNVIGSNIANVGMVIGISALIRTLRMDSAIVSREIPMMLLATAATVILGLDRLRGAEEAFDRSDGLILLLLFGVFLYYSISEVVASRRGDEVAEAAAHRVPASDLRRIGRGAARVAAGLALLVIAAEITVHHAVSLADAAGVPTAVVGLSVVAIGTSLPELATSVAATRQGLISLAVGNVVGSNLFNLLFILGATATIAPVPVPANGAADLGALAAFSAVLVLLSRAGRSSIARWHGALLLVAYAGYVVWRFAG